MDLKGAEAGLLVLVVAPALVGLGALAGGAFLLVKRPMKGTADVVVTVVGSLLLLVALGIGACYGVVFLG